MKIRHLFKFSKYLILLVFLLSCMKEEQNSKKNDLIWIIYNHDNSGILDGIVTDLAIEKDSCLWVITPGVSTGGLSRFDGNIWTNYLTTDFNSIAIDGKNRKWLVGKKVSMFNDTIWTDYPVNLGLDHSPIITDVAIDSLDNKWFTSTHGILKFDGQNWEVFKQEISFFSIKIDSKGNKWCGSQGNGVFFFDNLNWKVYDTKNCSLANDFVQDIDIDKNGNIWFATNDGISKFDGKDWMTYRYCAGERIYSSVVGVDLNNNIWFGGSFGIYRFDGNNWSKYDYKNSNFGFENYDITSIVADRTGNIWFGSFFGGVMKLVNGSK